MYRITRLRMLEYTKTTCRIPRNSNQVLGLARFADDFIFRKNSKVDEKVWKKLLAFHTDAVMCGVSALALKTNSPTILRNEALEYEKEDGARVFGSKTRVFPEKACLANCAAVREWDSNGTVFGYNEEIQSHRAGEFGHNDFYSVVIAAAHQKKNLNGDLCLRAMLCLDEIRGRLAEVFSLKTYKIDHVVHGAIASAVVYGVLLEASTEQIESAVGLVLAHYIPFRAIRAGKQLSDSKGASAAISTEVAILSLHRAVRGFKGPRDIFRNPEALFRFFEPTTGSKADRNLLNLSLNDKARWGVGDSPFDLVLTHSGDKFAVSGMHFKLGLYEHQSASAIAAVIEICQKVDFDFTLSEVDIEITAYEPAFGIIGDPAKKQPTTRQSADHSMAYIVARLLHKIVDGKKNFSSPEDYWREYMLTPYDYSKRSIENAEVRDMMERIEFRHGGEEFDKLYPEGIPTQVKMKIKNLEFDSGIVMFPPGHARNTSADLYSLLEHKNTMLSEIAFGKNQSFVQKIQRLHQMSNDEIQDLYHCELINRQGVD